MIQKENEWTALWQQHKSEQSTQPPLPTVDFTRESVIVVFIGGRSNGGFYTKITGIMRDVNRLVVIYQEVIAGSYCTANAIVTQPYHIIRLKRTDLPVLFQKQTEIYDCPRVP